MCKQGFTRHRRIFVKQIRFISCITFCHNGHINAFIRRTSLPQIAMRCQLSFPSLMNQNIRRINLMYQRSTHFARSVPQNDGDFCRLLGIRHQKCIFKSTFHHLGFLFSNPFLKQAGERSAVDNLPGSLILHGYLSISFQRKFRQMMASSCPLRKNRQFIQTNVLLVCISHKYIIQTKRLVYKIIFKSLRKGTAAK